MSLFDSLHDFFHRRAAARLDALASDLQLVTQRSESPRGNFVFPGTDYLDGIEVDGQRVGHVGYGLNPLLDRLYINMIEIDPARQGQGFGLGVLAAVAHAPGADCAASPIRFLRRILVPGSSPFCSGRP